MRRWSIAAAAAILALAIPRGAAAQNGNGQFQGFGGFTFGDVATASTFGGSLAIPLGSHVQIIGEGGRMDDLMPSLIDTALDLTPWDLRLGAYYGEAGIRVIGSHRAAVRPYAEATAGMARLNARVAGFDGPVDVITNTALRFLDTTKPLLGVGGGVIVQGGPVFVDLGYRYKQVMAGDSLQALLTGGDFGASQVRLGLGFRF
ncbi:MAG: hypothetical protein AB7F99_00550 [Vicinamibacterales bacterium]